MKTKIKNLLCAAIMMVLPLSFTSCDDILGHWERPVPVQAFMFKNVLDEGGTLNVKFNFSGNDYSVTFKKVGDKYQVQADGNIDVSDYDLTYKNGMLILDVKVEGEDRSQLFFDPDNTSYYIINSLDGRLTFDGKVTVNDIPGTVTNACPKQVIADVQMDDYPPTSVTIYYKEGDTWQDVVSRYSTSKFVDFLTITGNNVIVSSQYYNPGNLKYNTTPTPTDVDKTHKVGENGGSAYTDHYVAKIIHVG